MFIVFEGGEGCGKTTQAKRLYQHFLSQGKKVVLTREPGGTPNAEAVRELLVSGQHEAWPAYSEFFLILAARADHYEKFIKLHLDKGCIVICDRFLLSTLVYQGYGRGLDIAWMSKIHKDVFPDLLIDKTFVLSMSPEKALSRVQEQQTFEALGLEFHQKINQGFRELGKAFDMIEVEEKNEEQVFAEILEKLPLAHKMESV
ncbi:MAG: dTMP kinase [Alphaproteobacteria bacterium]|nr:MAG: dTMP kinase [Alphaproteobacteria bacterium]